MLEEFTVTQKRALAILTVVALFFGAYFLRRYLILIAVAAVIAYLFTPLYNRLRSRMNVGLSATFTLLATIAIVGIPLGGVIFLCRPADQPDGHRHHPLGRAERPDRPGPTIDSNRPTDC